MPDNTTSPNLPDEEKRKLLFVQLITSFQQAAWTGLGKIQGPDGKIAVDLEAATAYIDLLDMLRELTRGNLEEELSKLLDRLVGELKLNYLEESGREKPAAAATADAKADDKVEEEAAEEVTTAEAPAAADDNRTESE